MIWEEMQKEPDISRGGIAHQVGYYPNHLIDCSFTQFHGTAQFIAVENKVLETAGYVS